MKNTPTDLLQELLDAGGSKVSIDFDDWLKRARAAMAEFDAFSTGSQNEAEGFAMEAASEFGFEFVDGNAGSMMANGAQILALLQHVRKHARDGVTQTTRLAAALDVVAAMRAYRDAMRGGAR